MKPARNYTGPRLGRIEVVDDFLPPPDQLVINGDRVEVTISRSRKSVEFFKAEAAKSQVPYQRMIRALLDSYADRYTDPSRRRRNPSRPSA